MLNITNKCAQIPVRLEGLTGVVLKPLTLYLIPKFWLQLLLESSHVLNPTSCPSFYLNSNPNPFSSINTQSRSWCCQCWLLNIIGWLKCCSRTSRAVHPRICPIWVNHVKRALTDAVLYCVCYGERLDSSWFSSALHYRYYKLLNLYPARSIHKMLFVCDDLVLRIVNVPPACQDDFGCRFLVLGDAGLGVMETCCHFIAR